MGGGSFLGGWLAGDLATRKDHTAENNRLRTEIGSTTDLALAARSSVRNWQATAHNLQAALKARRLTEEELLEQLTAADMRVPLSDPDAFQAKAVENYAQTFTDPEVVSKTYDEGLPPILADEHDDWKKEKGIE